MRLAKITQTDQRQSLGRSYVAFANQGVEFGLFFRLPIRKITYSSVDYYQTGFYISDYIAICKSKLRRVWQYLLGNKQAVFNALDPEYFNNEENIGIEVNKFVFPIYFKRYYQEITCINMDDDVDTVIEWIESYGYHDKYTHDLGDCIKEVTKIHFKYKMTDTKIRTGKKYLYTHMIGMIELVKLIESKVKVTEDG